MDELQYFRTTLDHGVCEIRLPPIVTKDDVDALDAIWVMIEKRLRRRAAIAEAARKDGE